MLVLCLDLGGGAKQVVDDRPQACRVGIAGEAPIEAAEILGVPVGGAERGADGREDVADVPLDLSPDRSDMLAEAVRGNILLVDVLDVVGGEGLLALEHLVERLVEGRNETARIGVPHLEARRIGRQPMGFDEIERRFGELRRIDVVSAGVGVSGLRYPIFAADVGLIASRGLNIRRDFPLRKHIRPAS